MTGQYITFIHKLLHSIECVFEIFGIFYRRCLLSQFAKRLEECGTAQLKTDR